MKIRSNKFWLGVIGAVLLLCVAAVGFLWYRSSHASSGTTGPIAVVRLDGKIVAAVDLGKVKEAYTVSYTGESGNTNNVEFAPGKVRVHDATCPDQICVSQSWADETSLLPIACLPNSLIVQVSTAEDLGLDALTR